VDGRDPLADLAALRRELEFHLPGLSARPAIIVANKMDLEDAGENLVRLQAEETLPIVPTCAELMENRDVVIQAMRELLERVALAEAPPLPEPPMPLPEPPPPP
jgi:GTP-binding protein